MPPRPPINWKQRVERALEKGARSADTARDGHPALTTRQIGERVLEELDQQSTEQALKNDHERLSNTVPQSLHLALIILSPHSHPLSRL